MIVINEKDLQNKVDRIIDMFLTPTYVDALNLKTDTTGINCGLIQLRDKLTIAIKEIIRETPGLKACPFCGVMPKLDLVEDSYGLYYKIFCLNTQCAIIVETDQGERKEIIEQWNKRGGDK